MAEPIRNVRELLLRTAYRTIDVDPFLDPTGASWSRFDSEIGYVPNDVVMQDGVDGAWSVYTYERAGNRRTIHYADRPCRVNTYGDSFTQCQQVSDGETWQEFLAAHLREPVRNFGVGGYSVLAACLRMRRIEATAAGAEYVVLNIFDDDHVRNLDAARWIRSCGNAPYLDDKPRMMHGLPWSHVRYDPARGRFVDHPGRCATYADVRGLCDPERFYQTFKDDAIARLFVLTQGGEAEAADLEAVAEAFGVKVDLRDPARRAADAARLHLEYGLRSTEYVLDRTRAWAEAQGKKLRIILCYGRTNVGKRLDGQPRFDRRLLDYLERNRMPYVDTLEPHVENFKAYKLSSKDYLDRLYVPPTAAAVCNHHNPQANCLFAFFVKDAFVSWLDPKPAAYRHLA